MATQCGYNQSVCKKAEGLVQGGVGWSLTRWNYSKFVHIWNSKQTEEKTNKVEITELRVNSCKWDSYGSKSADDILKYASELLNGSASLPI